MLMIYEGQAITVQRLDDGVAQLDFNLQGESINKFNQATLAELKQASSLPGWQCLWRGGN